MQNPCGSWGRSRATNGAGREIVTAWEAGPLAASLSSPLPQVGNQETRQLAKHAPAHSLTVLKLSTRTPKFDRGSFLGAIPASPLKACLRFEPLGVLLERL